MTHKQENTTALLKLSDTDIRIRSYLIWEREGKPIGQAEQHWYRAICELQTEQQPATEATIAAAGKLAGKTATKTGTKSRNAGAGKSARQEARL
ncbi:MAG: DUF2934 domain-containing protein [Rhizomicrobium sp.]